MIVWGIDTGSLRLGLGMVDASSGAYQAVAFGWRKRGSSVALGRSLQDCRRATLAFMAIAAGHWPPDEIVFELASGRQRNPSLMFHGGVIAEATTTATDIAPHPISVTEWKKIVHGHGNATKAELIPWGDSVGCHGGDEDRIAALAIAAARAHQRGLDLARLHPTTPTERKP